MLRNYYFDDDVICSIEEQKHIIEWTKNNYHLFKKNGHNRYNCLISNFNDIPQCVWSIKNKIMFKENLYNYQQEPHYKDSLGYMFDNSQLHVHTDPNVGNLIHTRFNVYVKLPTLGGYPIYNGKVLRLKERTYLCCRAGLEPHFCQKVKGERIILSYGFLMPFNDICKINYYYQCNLNYSVQKKFLYYFILNFNANFILNYNDYFDNNKINTIEINADKLLINKLQNISIINNLQDLNYHDLIKEFKKFDFKYSLDGISTKLIDTCKISDIQENSNFYIFENLLNEPDKLNIVKKFFKYPCDLKNLRINRFYYGNKHTGTHLHYHSPALNYLFKGVKLWLIVEFNKENFSYLKLNNHMYNIDLLKKKNINILDWFLLNAVKIKNDIIDSFLIIQKKNEIIYIPDNCFHAVINLTDVLGFTVSW